MEKIEVCGGKYTIIFYPDGKMEALRYGEAWRDLTGDGMVLAMMHEIQDLKEKIQRMEDQQLDDQIMASYYD